MPLRSYTYANARIHRYALSGKEVFDTSTRAITCEGAHVLFTSGMVKFVQQCNNRDLRLLWSGLLGDIGYKGLTFNENQGEQAVNRIGDIALHHFKELRAFECYRHYYVKREEAQSIMRREMAKKSSTGFSSFVEVIIRVSFTCLNTYVLFSAQNTQ